MHIRTVSKIPRQAYQIEQILFVLNGIFGVIGTLFSTGRTALSFFEDVAGLLKPAA